MCIPLNISNGYFHVRPSRIGRMRAESAVMKMSIHGAGKRWSMQGLRVLGGVDLGFGSGDEEVGVGGGIERCACGFMMGWKVGQRGHVLRLR